METRTKNILLGGAALLGSALCGWYFYEKHHPHAFKRIKPISKALFIQIVKEQEREFYSILKIVTEISTEYLEKAEQMNFCVSPEAIQKIKDPVIDEKFAKIAKDIEEKYGVSEKEYEDAISITFKEDAEAISFFWKLMGDIENAFMGIAPSLCTNIPDFLTPEKTLEIYLRLRNEDNKNLQEYIQTILNEDASFWSNKENVTRFSGNARVQLRLSDEKRKIFAKEGFDAFEEAPERILDTAIAKYVAESFEFRENLEYMEIHRVKFDDYFPVKLLDHDPYLESK